MRHYVKDLSTLFSDTVHTGMPWCPGTPVSPGIPRWPCWLRNDPNHFLILLYETICYQKHKYFVLYYKNYTHNIELNSHSLVRETRSRPTPYHWPCFARQPRSTSFPPIPLENKSQLKKDSKEVCKKDYFHLCSHFGRCRVFWCDSVSVYPFYLFILAISFSRNSSVLIRFPSLNHFFISQLSKMIKKLFSITVCWEK